ncbi:MAG: SRPBCC family protein [Actinobacteria bacterium]|jgi:carbon monoxide dehydrogenase subunit G|nr:SRPBCC family protein [Actinomycetota bacterium]MDQ3533682.1 SRPBCC family protein [Actinomycetota bacterium]
MTVPGSLLRGWPIDLEMRAMLPGPPEIVWELITDWEHQDDWMLEASDFAVVSSHREGIGVEAEATISIGGIKTRDRVRITQWEPGQLLGIAHLGWVSGHADMKLLPSNGSTRLVWREHFTPPLGVVGALGMTLFKPIMCRIFMRDVRVLAGLVRARTTARRA